MRQTYISLTASRVSSREFGVIIDLGGGNQRKRHSDRKYWLGYCTVQYSYFNTDAHWSAFAGINACNAVQSN